MRYFKNPNGDVYAYDETISHQLPYMQTAINNGWEDITSTWTPPPPPPPPAPPTISDLQAQLATIQAQLTALANPG